MEVSVRTLHVTIALLCAVFAIAADTIPSSAQLGEKAKGDLKSIYGTPKLTNEPSSQYGTRSSAPSANSDDAAAAHKEESARQLRELQNLDYNRELRDEIRKRN